MYLSDLIMLLFPTRLVTSDRSFDRGSISDPSSLVVLKRGEQIQSLSEYWQIQSGVVRTVSWDADGHLRVLGLWGKGDLLGRSSSRVFPSQLECLSNATFTRLTSFQNLPDLLLQRQQTIEELLNFAYCRSVGDRLMQMLVWLGDRFGCAYQMKTEQGQMVSGRLIEVRLTHQQLADMAGTTRVTVTRLLSFLEQNNRILRLRRGHFLIIKDSLERL